ncbi:ABC transporter permease [Bosea sp. 2KB_26]|uniref:ABC transporter permease n=1 Tax=Bosea sp. 2KB_26 TaxID=3237475 RepID=UPI000DE44775
MTDLLQATPRAAKDGVEPRRRNRSLTGEALALLGRSPLVWVALVVLAILAAMAIAPGLFTNVDPQRCILLNSRKPPAYGSWFGFDIQGCDVFARTVYGARASLAVALLATLGSTLIGGALGLVAGFNGGIIDAVISRVTDVVLGLPTLLGAIVILATLGNTGGGVLRLALVLSLLGWATEARLMRASVLQIRNAEYVRAARVAGASSLWIALRHVLPNAVAPLLVLATLSLGSYVGTEATLSYLGLGLQPPTISWGTAISDAQPYLASAPHMLMFPSLVLTVTVLALVMLGEAVRRAFDPRSR